MTFVYGILGLGVIVFVHELGHFIAARLCGVAVESFSVGMGPVLLHKTFGGTDYRLSLIPLGGYCAMKGEKAFQDALEQKASLITAGPDELYGVHPLKRAFIAFCGPFFNILFAVLCYTVVSSIGYSYYSTGNRIIIASDLYPEMASIAREAGLQTGDRIIAINGKETPWFSDIYETVALNGATAITVTYGRDGTETTVRLTPQLDTSTGAGKIGVISWVDPLVSEVRPGSPAERAGLRDGDLITAVDGHPVRNTAELSPLVSTGNTHTLTVSRNGGTASLSLSFSDEDELGLYFHVEELHTPTYPLFPAIWHGVLETGNTIGITFKSLALLFKGVDLTKSVSGPVRITKMLGDTAIDGFSAGFSTGVVSVMNFLALINVSLFIMNLLPIPILDGGLVLFAFIEWVRRKQVHPRVLYAVQFIGIAFIALLFVFALFGDVRFLFGAT